MRPRDGFLVVGIGWVAISAFGALPYVLGGTLGPVDAWFESVSGFTTTGSTVLTGLESQPRSLLLWRSFTQWVGGMGIILFTIAILPLLGIGGMQLFKAEVPGPVADKISPRLAETARRLWLVYVGFTLAEVAALVLAGLSPFEALCHAFTTLATGGFSTRDLSVGAFESPLVEWIVVFFMVCAGMNFVLHYRILTGRARTAWRDAEFRYFVGVIVVATAIVGAELMRDEHAPADAVRLAAFQVVSLLSTTGFVTADFEHWAPLSHLVFLLLMVLGGMSGSTSGGVKSLRALIGTRALNVSFERLIHPHVVRSVKYAGRPVSEEVLAGIWAFFTAYALIAAAAAACLTAAGYDLLTAISAALTAIGNVGPGLGAVGAYDNFAAMPDFAKIVLSLCMLAGRLEVFTLLVLVVPRFWRR
jgi:trk system potassium uptake protein TrkH